jgi:hypothetical protein
MSNRAQGLTSIVGTVRLDAGVACPVEASAAETGADENEEDGSDEVVCEPEPRWWARKRCIDTDDSVGRLGNDALQRVDGGPNAFKCKGCYLAPKVLVGTYKAAAYQ